MTSFDTIIAPATPLGRSALAIVRIDGPLTSSILEALAPGREFPDRVATHVTLTHDGALLDDCVVTRYAAPRSFTGNDLGEISLHGNPLLVERLLRAATELGARLAEPGEFTERAVLNGKLDLVQAESIADLIASRTTVQANLSLSNLGGELSRTATRLRDELLFVISRLEAALDFSEEGYEFVTRAEATDRIRNVVAEVATIANTYGRGRATVDGLSAVILGAPNAGKSTLLNRLVGSERAIVTPIPGTTRDLLRETIDIGGLPVTLTDTAGLRESDDPVEGIGIERARIAARSADLVLYLIDSTARESELDRMERSELGDTALTIFTKSDLSPGPAGQLAISAQEGSGMRELLARLDSLVRNRFVAPEGSPTVVNARQLAALRSADEPLELAATGLSEGLGEEVVLVDLYRAAAALGTLIGEITTDDVYTEIFSKFCIGK
jgi:tRNA modification GTPase